DLKPVWVPDPCHEAMRDLVRARHDAAVHQTRMRQQLLAFLLRHGRLYEPNRKHWTYRHRQWLGKQVFDHPAQQAVFQDYMEAVWAASDRDHALRSQIEAHVADWSLGELVAALRCLRGIDMISATTILAGVGDLNRFETPRQFMGFLGLTPSEYSSGTSIRRGGITKAGNGEVRRMLVEAGWSYRYPARLSQDKVALLDTQSANVRKIAWTAQERLCRRYRQLTYRGKKPTVVVTAIARELSGFVWALGQEIGPRPV
ncbi:MAG: IS110 family transposase, partial [Pseudomonadota bacterium]